MIRKLLTMLAVLALCLTSVSQTIAAPAQGPAAAGSAAQNGLPSSPTDQSKVPHYYGPYPNWANSPQALADAVVKFTPASAAPVSIGNALSARGFATDWTASPGIAPAFVVVPTPLPKGTLTAFQTLNQAAAGGSPAPSAGNTFNAYVLRPTATPNQYTVVFDSGTLTVPALANPAADATASFPVNVSVQAGDVIAFYGAGVPYDVAPTGADVISSPVTAAPAANATITVGDAATFPLYTAETRTYSFSARITPAAVDPGVGAEATATVDPATSGIKSVTVTKPGSGYLVPPTVTIEAPGLTPTPATAVATISTGVVSSVSVAESGFGFTHPSVAVSGGSPTTAAVLTASGGVDDLTLTDGGSGYTAPTAKISLPDLPNGVPATASVTMSGGVITGITIANAGSGYTSAPTVTILDAGVPSGTPALATATINVLQIDVTDGGAGYTDAPTVTITDVGGVDRGATATASVSVFGAVTDVTVSNPGSGYITPGIKKFVDTLPGVGESQKNDLDQYIPVATPDTETYPGSDYYEIGLVQYRMKFHKDLPATLLRGYVQLSTAKVPGKHIALTNANLDPNLPATPVLLNGSQVYGVDNPHYLGPAIVATKDRPVRVVFRNLLPTGSGGDLFLPVDTSFMGAGDGPDAMMLNPDGTPMDMTQNDNSVMDAVRNPRCAADPKPQDCYTENRATIHLHGGITPWISDGTPHQWITPAGETTDYPKGVSVQNVPDMPDPGPGAQTFFYTNQQSARLLFYHDHAWGITRLNVYAGEAAPYLITDDTEKKLISDGLIPDAAHTKDLVIQDKTFVPDATAMALEDPTWDYQKYGGYGNLWYEHVYMPAENPNDPSGVSAYGRWFYGPYFWPPSTSKYGPIANPYYDAACKLDDPATWQYKVDPYCEPPTIPGTPNSSSGMEQFNDTPVVNGTAYPKTSVDPTTYRFRILNAANDRFWNLQWYVADPRTGTLSEVALDAAKLADAQTNPNAFPTPDTKWSPAGPSWVQIGTEGGFLSAPAVIPNQPITWITDQTRFDFGNVDQHSLLLAPAERADVIVDFSQFRGKTLILYNDAPAAFPGRIPCYDYYTGGPDMTPGCAPSTLPGYGPNTRTIMRVDVSTAAPTVAFDRPNTTNDGLGRLQAAFAHHLDANGNPAGVFETGQNPIVVGQAAYNATYGTNFVSGSWCNDPKAAAGTKCDGLARISEQGGDLFKFDTLSGNQLAIPIQPKALHDEMNSSTFDPYGRMTSNMGVEAPGSTPLTQNIVIYPYVNPATEVFDESNSPDPLNVTPISTTSDGTQIWKITHNGVDTHPIHFHLYDIQVINRVTWDNIIIPPDPNELGWKDTVRVSPLEDTYVAVRPIVPRVPFGVPDSHRLLNPMMPEGARGTVAGMVMGPNGTAGIEAGFNNTDVNGNPINPIVNSVMNFGWEYVWHCHILSHEEMDMMRPQIVNVPHTLPDAPVLSWSAGTAIQLDWTDGTPVNYADPTTWGSPKGEVGYKIERADVAGETVGAYSQIATGIANQITYTDLDVTAGNKYSYRVTAWNEAGDSVSNTVIATIGQSAPGRPTGVTAVAGNQMATVSWVAPVNDGNSPITGYTVTSAPGGVTCTTTGALTCDVLNLTKGTSYTFTVTATNAVGTSLPSLPSAPVTPFGPPDPPTSVTATASPGQAVVSWLAPANDGASPITAYTVTSNPGNLTCTTTGALTCTVTGLTNGTAYTFTVTATNAIGTSLPSAPSAPVTPLAVPGAPTGATAVAGNTTATISWTAPASNGGTPITGYTVTSAPGGLTCTTVSAVTCTVLGLTNGTSYTFTVTATNAVGTSAPSAPSNAVTPATVPDAPRSVTAVPANASATVSWLAPLSNGGMPITGYTVTSSPGNLTCTTTGALTCTVTGLTNGTSYTFTVTATNAIGTGAAGGPSAAVTPTTVPGAPTGVTATPGNASATVSWTAPASNGGTAITGYTVTSAPGGFTCTTTGALTCTVTGLTNGTAYTFTVKATNATGTGPASAPSAAVTPATVPGAPTGVTAVRGNASATVSWTAPASNGGATITAYTVTSVPGGFTCTTTGALTCTVTGLTNGTAYTFLVTATNWAGTGPSSLPSAPVLVGAAPDAPTGVTATAGNRSAAVTWLAPANTNGGAISGYTVTSNPGNLTCTTTGALTCTVTGLTNGTFYTFTVKATNQFGTSVASAPSAAVMPLAGALYVPLTPNRIVDSRSGTGISSTLQSGVARTFQVTGRVPADATRNVPANAIAVTGNLTIVNASAGGYVALTTLATNVPSTSTINLPARDTRANGVTIPLSSTGSLGVVYLATTGSTADVLFDVTGYFVKSTTGASYFGVTPNRIVDSRSGTRLGLSSTLTAGVPATFTVTNRVPADATRNIPTGATAVVGNLTVANATASGNLALTTTPTAAPSTSTLNFPQGDVRSNNVIVQLSPTGTLSVTLSGQPGVRADVIFDVTGYFMSGTTGATYVPLTPNRILDSRNGTRLGLAASLTSGTPATFAVENQFSGDVTRNVPTEATAVVGNLTAVNETARGFFALTTVATANPPVSTINFPARDIRANGATMPLSSTGTLSVVYQANGGARADVLFDVTGYYAK